MRKLFFIFIMLCGVTLTGCAQLVDMNEQESDMVAEYMAGTVLRHTENYDEALIYPDTTESDEADKNSADIAATTEPTTTPATVTPAKDQENTTDTLVNTAEDNNGLKDVGFAEFMNGLSKNKFSITYSNYKFYDSYPDENDYFTIVPSKGKQLILLTFKVKNTTDKTQTFNLSESQIIYELETADGKVYNPMMTLLEEDIQYINLKIGAGKSQKAEIVFDVSKNIDKSDLKLKISYKDKTTTLDLNQ